MEQIDESICEQFDNQEPRYQDHMILHLVRKVRQLIDEVNELKEEMKKMPEIAVEQIIDELEDINFKITEGKNFEA